MNEVEIPLKITGISAIKAELRALKGEIANATDPQEVQRLAQEAGVLADKIKDANEQVQIFTSGSKFESVSNSFGQMKNDLLSLDFEGAAQKAQVFNQTVGSLSSKDIQGGFRGLISTVVTLGKTFVQFGIALLANPLFLLVAVIVAIVTAVVSFLNKLGFLKKAFEIIMIPINLIIEGFKALTDFLGITDHAGEEAAANEKARQEELMHQKEMAAAQQQMFFDATVSQYDREIALMEAQGKDTRELTKLKIEASIANMKQKKLELDEDIKFYELRVEGEKKIAALAEIAKQSEKTLLDLKKQRQEADQAILDSQNQLQINEINNAKKDVESIEERQKAYKAYKKDRLDAARTATDLELDLMKEGTEKELKLNQLKYDRLIADLKRNENLNNQEKIKLTNLYLKIQEEQAKKIRQKEIDDIQKQADAIAQKLEEIEKAKIAKKQEANLIEANRRVEARLLIDEITQTEYEKELSDLQTQLAQRLALVTGNAQQEATVRADFARQSRLLEINEAEKRRQAILNIATSMNEGLTHLGTLFIKDQKKLEKFNKAAALIQIGIDTARAISSLVAASQANPLNGVTFGGAGAAQYVTGLVQILSNMARAKQILSNPSTPPPDSPPPPAPNGGGGGTTTTSTQTATPSVTLFGQPNQFNNLGNNNQQDNNQTITVNAIVSETQITDVQNKIANIKKNAEL